MKWILTLLLFSLSLFGQSTAVWSLVGGMLPPGLTLDTKTGIISGSPTQVGAFTFTIGVEVTTILPDGTKEVLRGSKLITLTIESSTPPVVRYVVIEGPLAATLKTGTDIKISYTYVISTQPPA